MNKIIPFISCFLLSAVCMSCATVSPPQEAVEAPVSQQQQRAAQVKSNQIQQATLKRKIAIGRFSNETYYGKTFFRDADMDPLGKQASEMLGSKLVDTQKFLIFERSDISKILREQDINKDSYLVGVDTLILGAVTEFGRSTKGQTGFLSATKMQVAHAKVDLRLVDVQTGQVFFAVTGAGEATSEAGQIAGFGSKADYDATLNDRAIDAAISAVVDELITKIEARPWKTDILKIAGNKIYISGGKRQGIKIGDELLVVKKGENVKSQQTGFLVSLPATPQGKIKIVELFGESETNEGAIAEIISGSFIHTSVKDLLVTLQGGH